jgi:hypothetical protein
MLKVYTRNSPKHSNLFVCTTALKTGQLISSSCYCIDCIWADLPNRST